MLFGCIVELISRGKSDSKNATKDEIKEAIKYVYRKADKIEDVATKSNLEQIKKSLDKIQSDLK